MKKGVLGRLFKLLFADYKARLFLVAVCIIITSVSATSASVFMSILIPMIEEGLVVGWAAIKGKIFLSIGVLGAIYLLGLVASYLQTRVMAVLTQDFLNSIRKKLFAKMQTLPIKYFDSTHHGDIMSHYTNDIDTIRELVSRSIPQLFSCALIISILVCVMLYLSIWLFLIILLGVVAMIFVTKKIGGGSAKYFIKQQKTIGKTEGFIEEMMNGQKVVKVFCHEKQSEADFDKVNDALCSDATKANRYANILMPIMGNIGNILYVLVAVTGGAIIC